jgi:hypothetical protein
MPDWGAIHELKLKAGDDPATCGILLDENVLIDYSDVFHIFLISNMAAPTQSMACFMRKFLCLKRLFLRIHHHHFVCMWPLLNM